MKIDKASFAHLVNRAMRSNNVFHMRAVKELLHYDILFALDRGGLLDKYIFQEGRHYDYGLEVMVKEPKQLITEPQYSELTIKKWQVSELLAQHLA